MIIGIAGPIGSGKTTICEHIRDRYNAEIINYADPLKEIAVVLGFDRKDVFGSQEQKEKKNEYWNVTNRKLLQVLGTDIFRDSLPKVLPEMKDIWIRLAFLRMKQKPSAMFVIGDVRFDDEAKAIKDSGGIIVKLKHAASASASAHSSEAGITIFDKEIESYLTNPDVLKNIDSLIT